MVGADDRQNLSDERGCEIIHYACLNIHDEVCAALSLLKRNMLHFRCRGALLRGEGENAGALDLGFEQEAAQLLKLILALAWQTGNKACAQNKSGDTAAQSFKQCAYIVARAVPVHGFQDLVIYMLDGYVQIFYYLGIGCDLVDKLIVELIGIGVMQAYPFNAVDLAYPAAKLCKAAFSVKIRAVARYILRDDDDLLHAVSCEVARFLNNVFHLSRAVSAAYVRNRAEGAEVITALGDAQICPRRAGAYNARYLVHGGAVVRKKAHRLFFKNCVHSRNDIAEAADAEDGVNLRKLIGNCGAVAFGKAAGHYDLAESALGFELCHFKNGIDRFAFCGVYKAAGVYYNCVRAVRRRGERIACFA